MDLFGVLCSFTKRILAAIGSDLISKFLCAVLVAIYMTIPSSAEEFWEIAGEGTVSFLRSLIKSCFQFSAGLGKASGDAILEASTAMREVPREVVVNATGSEELGHIAGGATQLSALGLAVGALLSWN